MNNQETESQTRRFPFAEFQSVLLHESRPIQLCAFYRSALSVMIRNRFPDCRDI